MDFDKEDYERFKRYVGDTTFIHKDPETGVETVLSDDAQEGIKWALTEAFKNVFIDKKGDQSK